MLFIVNLTSKKLPPPHKVSKGAQWCHMGMLRKVIIVTCRVQPSIIWTIPHNTIYVQCQHWQLEVKRPLCRETLRVGWACSTSDFEAEDWSSSQRPAVNIHILFSCDHYISLTLESTNPDVLCPNGIGEWQPGDKQSTSFWCENRSKLFSTWLGI